MSLELDPEDFKGMSKDETLASLKARMDAWERNRPWYEKVKGEVRGWWYSVNRAWDRVVDLAHRPFYRHTVPREYFEDHCLCRYCHNGSNLAHFLYQHPHYVTRNLSQLWVKHPETVETMASLSEGIVSWDRSRNMEKAMRQYLDGNKDWTTEGLILAVRDSLESWKEKQEALTPAIDHFMEEHQHDEEFPLRDLARLMIRKVVHGGEKTIQWSACVCAGAGGVKVGHWIG